MPKIVDHDQRREELLTRSFALWANRGYSGITMRELAKALDVSTGTLYHYFQNKDDLFVQMVEWMGNRDVMRGTSLLQQAANQEEKLEVLFRYIQQEEGYFQKLILIALDYHRHQVSPSNNILAKVLSGYRSAIQRELGLAEESTAMLLLSLLLGMLVQRLMDPDQVDLSSHLTLLRPLATLVA